MITYLGQCGFVIEIAGLRFAIDPVLCDLTENGKSIRVYPPLMQPEELNVDYILCTHEHIDHMDLETIKRVYAKDATVRFAVPAGCVEPMYSAGIAAERIVPLSDAMIYKLSDHDVSITGIQTAHPEHRLDAQGRDCNLGYCIEANGIRIVHLGDTYLTERLYQSLSNLGHIDVLMAPINGNDDYRESIGIIGNMDAEEVVTLAQRLQVGMLIPMHFDMVIGNTADPEAVRYELAYRHMDTKLWVPDYRSWDGRVIHISDTKC